MASEWYHQASGEETGPVPFAELVQLVQDETLEESSLVRRSDSDKWQRADSVVGLYHMARRQPAQASEPEPEDEPTVTAPERAEGPDEGREMVLAGALQPSWWERILNLLLRRTPTLPFEAMAAATDAESFTRDSEPDTISGVSLSQAAVESPLQDVPAYVAGRMEGGGGRAESGERRADGIASHGISANGERDAESQRLDSAEEPAAADTASLVTAVPESGDGTEGVSDNGEWSATVDAALEKVDARTGRQERQKATEASWYSLSTLIAFPLYLLLAVPRFLGRLLQRVFDLVLNAHAVGHFANWLAKKGIRSSGRVAWSIRHGVRIVPAIICANLVLIGVRRWAEREAMRFPTGKQQVVEYRLPFVGACGPAEYWFLLIDAMLVAAGIAYAIGFYLEKHADDS